MVTVEVDKFKCLICEISLPQKGLTFFKFPKEEFRLKMWIKEISPLLDILKIQPNSLKENGRICARHFREKDFINCKQNSLVYNACPSLSVSNLNLNGNLQKNIHLEGECFAEEFSNDEQPSDGSETDLFQCGRCKTQFEMLSEFIGHKRFRCQLVSRKLDNCKIEKTDSSLQDYLPAHSSFINNLISERAENSSSEQVFKIISEGSSHDDKVVSLVLDENRLMVGNPDSVPALSTPVIITPQLPLCYNGVVVGNPIDLSLSNHVIVTPQTSADSSLLLNNTEPEAQISNLILTINGSNNSEKRIMHPCPKGNNNELAVNSETLTNQFMFKNEVNQCPSENVEDSDQTFTYCKLTNAVFESQQTSLINLKKREIGVGRSNKNEGSRFEKSKTKLPCSYCRKVFNKPFNLQQHERIHTGERPFQCIVCGRAFTQKSNVRKHMMRHRVWPKGKQTLKLRTQDIEGPKLALLNEIDYFCQYCTLSFKSYAEHKKHLAVHSNFKVYRCIQKGCNETFSDLDEFLSHSKMHSSTEFQCHICLKAFSNLEELGGHQYDHDKTGKGKRKETETKLKCRVCHARFKTIESLKNHLAVDTHNYECSHCGSVFCSERFLRRHLFIHTNSSQSKFKCQNCKKSFRTQQNLKNHIFIHLKEKPFTCDHCHKQFASKYRLKRHVAIHLNQYFNCPFKKHLGCDKTFYRKDKLKDHVSTHSHCKVRSCRICSKLYWTMSELHQHMKNNNEMGKERRGVMKCFGCSQTFRKQKQMSTHHCTIEGKMSTSRLRNLGAIHRTKNSESVSNIEIIMVPLSENEDKMN